MLFSREGPLVDHYVRRYLAEFPLPAAVPATAAAPEAGAGPALPQTLVELARRLRGANEPAALRALEHPRPAADAMLDPPAREALRALMASWQQLQEVLGLEDLMPAGAGLSAGLRQSAADCAAAVEWAGVHFDRCHRQFRMGGAAIFALPASPAPRPLPRGVRLLVLVMRTLGYTKAYSHRLVRANSVGLKFSGNEFQHAWTIARTPGLRAALQALWNHTIADATDCPALAALPAIPGNTADCLRALYGWQRACQAGSVASSCRITPDVFAIWAFDPSLRQEEVAAIICFVYPAASVWPALSQDEQAWFALPEDGRMP